VAPPGRRCQNGGLEGWFLREPRDWVVGWQRNQIARGAGLLQRSSHQPGQRRCRSPALRAIGLRGRTVAGGVAPRDRLFGGRCRNLVNRWSGARRKGLFARPAPHATAGTLPGGLQGADACVNEGIWLWGGSGTKSPGGPGSYREASAGQGRGAEHDGIVRQGSLLWQEGWWHHLGGGVRTAGCRGMIPA